MALIGSNNEEKIWNYLKEKINNDYGVAGLMGNINAESAMRSNNLQNTYERSLGYSDDVYVSAVDSGAYTNFVHDSAGFGICQWTYYSRKQNLLNYAKSRNKSVGDLEMQLGFLYKELNESYQSVLITLKNAKSVREASDVVLLKFECPADQSEPVRIQRAYYGQSYYNKYANEVKNMSFKMRTTKPEAGNKYYITKANGGYSDAIKGNSKYRDKDCDVLPNCVGYAYGRFNEIGGYGCCKYLYPTNAENFMSYKGNLKVGQTPKVGACMVWQKGATLAGSDGAGHVAIVEKVISDTEVYTSESGWSSSKPFWNQTRQKGDGNWGQNSTYKFLGFIYNPAVKETDATTPVPSKPVEKPSASNSSDLVYVVKAGDTLFKIASQYGTTYQELAKYNNISNPNFIRIGQKIKISASGITKNWTPKVGDIVIYNGNQHYVNANALVGKKCKGGKAKITQIYQLGKSKHPYHLVAESSSGSNVYGWVDAGSFTKA